ncbi:MAG: hypothetical protein ACRD23_18840 [Terriglobales bacterium]
MFNGDVLVEDAHLQRRAGTPVLHYHLDSAAPWAARLCGFVFLAKGSVGCAGGYQFLLIQEARIGSLVEDFAQSGSKNAAARLEP